MAQLSEWLQLMLAEIARKEEEQRRAWEEQRARSEDPDPRSKAAPSG